MNGDLERNPWTRRESHIIYQNPWLTLREDRVVRPNGREGVYSVVETRIATGVVTLTPDYQTWLVGQYRYPTESYSWEIVEGGAHEGEAPLTCIQRELREEAGLLAGRWTSLSGTIYLSNCISSEVGYLFLAEDLVETEPEPDETEILQLCRVPLGKALAMADQGEITDAMSIMGLFMAERYLWRTRGLSFREP
ncbi:MAG: NUDIX domain-containing protein [Candidatus Hydrogenedentota bacterium]